MEPRLSPARIAIVEDQTIFREMLTELLSADASFEVVGQFRDGQRALQQLAALVPDVVVLDIVLPDTSGLEVLRALRALARPPRVVVVTACEVPLVIRNAADAGASGIVAKSAPLAELKTAVQRVANGASHFCPLASRLLQEAAAAGVEKLNLTPRERSILQRVAQGATSKDIARELEISLKTVLNHRQNLMNKLGLHDVASLTRFAITNGFATPM